MPSSLNQLSLVDQLHRFVRTKTTDAYQNMAKGIPGHVSKILANDFIEFTIDATGPYTLPTIKIPQAFSKYHREPTQVGDKGVAVPTDYNLGGESGNDGSTANLYPRGNLTPLTFHPISNKNWPTKDPNMFLVTGGPSGHTTQSQDGKTSTVIDNQNNINHTSSAAITSKAASTNTVSSTNQGVNIVTSPSGQVTVGASNNPNANPPIPSLQTIMNVIGSITASGMMSAAGGFGGTPGGGTPPAGSMGEVISSVVTTAINLTSGAVTQIATITLTSGDWDVSGEVWYTPSATLNAVASGINSVLNFPGGPTLGAARTQITASLGNATITPLSTCRVNITANTVYYLIGYAAIASGTCTATGKIWARRI